VYSLKNGTGVFDDEFIKQLPLFVTNLFVYAFLSLNAFTSTTEISSIF